MKRSMAIGMVVFCFMIMSAGAAWCGNYAFTPPNGALFDNNTGLVWLQNANCFGQKSWADARSSVASLKSGSCGLTDGSIAGKWRLPTKAELVAKQKNQEGFNSIQASWYWSDSTNDLNTTTAWVVGMKDLFVGFDSKSNGYYVWPVRPL